MNNCFSKLVSLLFVHKHVSEKVDNRKCSGTERYRQKMTISFDR